MALILNIETSTQVCSVNIAKDGVKLAGRETCESNAHSKVLTVFIEEILNEMSIGMSAVDAIAVSKGPGSYTGLRIGVSAAKGLAYGAEKKLISVSTLLSMAWGARERLGTKSEYILVPMIDARRMEVYTQFFDPDLLTLNPINASIIDETFFNALPNDRSIFYFGDGAEKCRQFFSEGHVRYLENIVPSSDFMISFSEQYYRDCKFEDVAYFEPFYLKDFIATIPRKNIFGNQKEE